MIGGKKFTLMVAAMLLLVLAAPVCAAEKTIELAIPGCGD
jgi:hypothetical protein